MTKGFIISLLLHAFLLYLLFFYLPRVISSDRIVEVSVDIISFEKVLPDVVPVKPKQVEKPKQRQAEEKKDNKIRQEKKIVEKPKPELPKEKPKEKEVEKPPVIPVEKKPETKEEIQQKEYVEDRKVDQNKVDSLLDELKKLQAEEIANAGSSSGSLTEGEIGIVRTQVKACWHNSVGKLFAREDLQGMQVKVYVALDAQGYVQEVRHLDDYDKYLALDNVLYRQIVDSAIESFLSCKRIYNLPPEKYDAWKEFEFTFVPAEY